MPIEKVFMILTTTVAKTDMFNLRVSFPTVVVIKNGIYSGHKSKSDVLVVVFVVWVLVLRWLGCFT